VSEPVAFLHALSQALATMGLYGDGHPAPARAAALAHERLEALQADDPRVRFTFLSGEVLFGDEVQPELAGWEWSERFAGVGVERLEFTGPVALGQLERLLAHLAARVGIRAASSADAWQSGESPVRLGLVALAGDGGDGAAAAPAIARLSYNLHEEREAIGWIHDEVRSGSRLPLVEADAVVRSLSLAMHAEQAMVLPLLQLKEFDQYTTTHSMNVSVLAMALGEFLELGSAAVRSLGFAALLHDLGKVCIPEEILNKPGRLTDEERKVVERHPVVGAKLLLDSPDALEIAAVVAYEHHIFIDGGGYPLLPDARGAQYASRLVHICDVYDALRTKRPYRDAWESERAIGYIESRAGIEFDPTIVRAFVAMMRKWDRTMAARPGPAPIH
jgi:putative nucleotidyltransferase with HDIG domain